MPSILDLCCKQGGASKGYELAGFDDIVGVDIDPQPLYPYEFEQADALEFLEMYGEGFDLIHASPPCQAYTNAQRIYNRSHPELLEPLRNLLEQIGKPYVIENVPGAPLDNPIMLCGAMFDLGTYRHRLFETSFDVPELTHNPHVIPQTKMGRTPVEGEMLQIVGNFSGVKQARLAMGIDWMNRDGLREAIPPAYTEYIASHL